MLLPKGGRRPRLGRIKINLAKFDKPAILRGGEKIRIRNILQHPDILSRESTRWGRLSRSQRGGLMRSLSGGSRLDRSLLAQTLRMWRKDFPLEERQKFSAWRGSFSQNLKGTNDANYHFIAAYGGTRHKPELMGYSTLHASIPRADLPTPVALAEYAAVKNEYRNRGIYDLLFQKRRMLAKKSKSRYIVAEVDPFSRNIFRRWKILSELEKTTPKQQARFVELDSRRRRLLVFDKYYKKLDMPYLDPSEHVSFSRSGRGVLDRNGKLNQLWLLVHDLEGRNSNAITRNEALNILKSVYRGPQDLRKNDADFVLSRIAPKIKEAVALRSPRKAAFGK